MDSVNSFLSGFGNMASMNWSTIAKTNDISRDVQKHLFKMYMALAACMVCSAAGAYANVVYGYGGHMICFALSFGLLMWLQWDQKKTDTIRRTAILCAFGFVQGMGIGGLVGVALYINPGIVLTAVLGCVIVFTCFSLAALVSPRRSYMYLGGMLSSALSIMCFLHFMNYWLKSTGIYTFEIFAGLLMLSGFVIFDTQMIVEKAAAGNRDFAGHASELFVDLIGIFVRLLLILIRKSQADEDHRRKNKRGPY